MIWYEGFGWEDLESCLRKKTFLLAHSMTTIGCVQMHLQRETICASGGTHPGRAWLNDEGCSQVLDGQR